MSDFLTGLLSGGVGVAVVTGIFSLIKWRLERKAQKADREEARDDESEQRTHQEIERLQEQMAAVVLANQMQMRAIIRSQGKECIDRGSITSTELEDLMQYHEVYHYKLNGNGFLDSLMIKVKKLPIKNN